MREKMIPCNLLLIADYFYNMFKSVYRKYLSKFERKVQTLNREGVGINEVSSYLDLIKSYPKLNLEGICTHLADADNESNDFADKQHENFKKALKIVKSKGFDPRYKHISATAGSYKIKNKEMNAIRLGIGLYGINPCVKFDQKLKPALRLISTVVSRQNLERGDKVGYGCTFEARKKMKIGLLPVGYFECFDRRLSGKGYVKANGQFLPIVGRVCMNLTCFDMRGLNMKVGDEVVAISEFPRDKNSVENIAELVNTLPYEVMVKINESIRKVVV